MNFCSSATRSLFMAVGILIVPLVAMRFSGEVNWDTADFLIMGTLIFGTAMVFEFAMSQMRDTTHRILIGTAIIALFIYIWAELAVGIFTNLGS